MTPFLSVAFCPHRVVLEGNDLSLKLLIELSQFFLFAKDVVTIERHLCPLARNLTVVVLSSALSSLVASKTAGLLSVKKGAGGRFP